MYFLVTLSISDLSHHHQQRQPQLMYLKKKFLRKKWTQSLNILASNTWTVKKIIKKRDRFDRLIWFVLAYFFFSFSPTICFLCFAQIMFDLNDMGTVEESRWKKKEEKQFTVCYVFFCRRLIENVLAAEVKPIYSCYLLISHIFWILRLFLFFVESFTTLNFVLLI